MTLQSDAVVVHKFGGAALANDQSIHSIAQLIATLYSKPIVITVSAMATVSNTLLEIAATAGAGDKENGLIQLEALRCYTNTIWAAVCGTAPPSTAFDTLFTQVAKILEAASAVRSITPRELDTVAALGEQLSAYLMVGRLRKAGLWAQYIDATTLIATDGCAGNAAPDLARTTQNITRDIVPMLETGMIPVVPGFIGYADDGATVTLGRGGTDLTATTLGAALNAREVILWKDVPGFLTADPRIVPDARVIDTLHIREAMELAYYGATVLHPRALLPIRGSNCRVRVRSFLHPELPGTIITDTLPKDPHPVRAISATKNQSLVTIRGNGQLSVSKIAARVFSSLERFDIPVSLVTQASSECSICLAVDAEHGAAVRAHLAAMFDENIAQGSIDSVDMREDTVTIAIVGLRMAGSTGLAARVFHALGRQQINIVAIAQGSTEINISVAVDASDSIRAQQAIHHEFQLSKIGGGRVMSLIGGQYHADVIILGFGTIGRTLVQLLSNYHDPLRSIRIVGIVDRSGYRFDPEGLSEECIEALRVAKQSGISLADIDGSVSGVPSVAIEHILSHALRNPVVVDVSVGESSEMLEYALMRGAHVVLANKRPVSGERLQVDRLRATSATHGRRILYEATVGAGLPILDTFTKLVEAGDFVHSIEGCPSGTMGYLFGQLEADVPFSRALQQAMQLGYTEPDPRDDLSGIDVARKGLILGRLLGFAGELSDVQVESLVPLGMNTLPLCEFMEQIECHDDMWARRVGQARSRGMVLRYRAAASSESVSVGLVEVPASGPLGVLSGTDNQFTFTTARYRSNPLVITGPGAGPDVTAAGVLNDVLKLTEVL